MRAPMRTRTPWQNLHHYYAQADAVDLNEGMVAYERYHMVMRRLAEKYQYPLDATCAVFCSLSPNSDYWGNLRSTVTVLQGLNEGRDAAEINVSTYRHCMLRAIAYARGASFTAKTKGPKILNFYHNILTPHSSRWVTIDGHMVGIMRDSRATMRELLIKPHEYEQCAYQIKQFAFNNFMLPNQMQAILWFVRKRLLNVVYDGQFDMFGESNDAWKTARDVDTIKPYSKRESKAFEMRGEPAGLVTQLLLEGGECREARESRRARRLNARSARP